ncbi:MAG TPA: exodeoxyribonuclease VII small subunit [Patescibacteria group bacterium]|nr:exodeoxyribonuclease VII small subunit [Patescibacteria group bacterium]
MSNKPNTIAEKRTALNELLAWFESDDFTVEEAVDNFKKAETLAKEIEDELMSAKNTITELKQRFDESA